MGGPVATHSCKHLVLDFKIFPILMTMKARKNILKHHSLSIYCAPAFMLNAFRCFLYFNLDNNHVK